jgi:hypothetical protein
MGRFPYRIGQKADLLGSKMWVATPNGAATSRSRVDHRLRQRAGIAERPAVRAPRPQGMIADIASDTKLLRTCPDASP